MWRLCTCVRVCVCVCVCCILICGRVGGSVDVGMDSEWNSTGCIAWSTCACHAWSHARDGARPVRPPGIATQLPWIARCSCPSHWTSPNQSTRATPHIIHTLQLARILSHHPFPYFTLSRRTLLSTVSTPLSIPHTHTATPHRDVVVERRCRRGR
jgi:hypothetical protein